MVDHGTRCPVGWTLTMWLHHISVTLLAMLMSIKINNRKITYLPLKKHRQCLLGILCRMAGPCTGRHAGSSDRGWDAVAV